MKRRFSRKGFALALLIHFLATWWLFATSFRALAAWKRTGAAAEPLWPTISAWVLQPVSMFALHFLRLGLEPSGYFYFFMLPWMIIVAFCFGLLIPHFSRSTPQNI